MKLEGIRVVDLSLFLPGPTLSLMMSDQGADVIKVESVDEGEPNRHIGQRRDGVSVYFAATHRGKRSVALNLKHPDGHAALMRLVATADVVVEAFRPGVAKRLGVDYDTLRAHKPDLVYVSISAFGQDGPLASRPAHDLAVEAMCGLLSNNIDREGRPVLPAMPAGDMLAAALGLSGVLMALLRRTRTGEGDYLDLSMMDSILASMPNSVGAVFGDQRPPVHAEERIWGGNAFYRVYATQDGRYIALGGAEAKFARNLLTALGRADLAPLCDGPAGARQRPVIDYLEAEFLTRTQAEWLDFMARVDVCYAPMNDLRTGFDLEQVRHREMRLVDERGWEHIGTPFKFRNEPGQVRFAPPGHGEHTRAVLQELGYAGDAVDALFAAGAAADRTGTHD